MLHYNTIEDKTLALLKNLMLDNALMPFNLAGGTSLALQIGHRKSIDLDMFSKDDFDFEDLRRYMIEKYAFMEIVLMLDNSVIWKNIEQRLSDMKKNETKVFQEPPITVSNEKQKNINHGNHRIR